MLFTPDHARAVLAGDKTQTRRLVVGEQQCTYREGRSYALQRPRRETELSDKQRWDLQTGRVRRPYKTTVGRIVVVPVECDACEAMGEVVGGTSCPRCQGAGLLPGVRREFLGDITHEDARREGFGHRLAFQCGWVGLHDFPWLDTTTALLGDLDASTDDLVADGALERHGMTERALRARLRFLERAGAVVLSDEGVWERQQGAELTAAEARFDQRWAKRRVWVITFTVDDTERGRHLAPAARPLSSDTGYLPDRAYDQLGREITFTDEAAEAPGTIVPVHRGRWVQPEPEAVHEQAQAEITKQADTTGQQWKAREAATYDADRRQLAHEERVRRATVKARAQGVDVEREVWMVRKMQAEGRPPETVEQYLERLERKAFTARLGEVA